ncbi:subtilisin-like protein [Durotheca rogersii]|uniref:subtilisin-like protein n=1 Tax=Durotheca rogersii TaxID=419775 RepID=UPI0022203A46|nr:subtilisin-like protein [Durotheca rogersii]KAI5868199.1 subtilisin-like protein [Durotheca rogersii]
MQQRKRSMFAVVLAGVLGLALPALAAPLSDDLFAALRDGDAVPQRYIVSLKPGVAAADHLAWVRGVHRRSVARRSTAGLEKTFSIGDFHAYAGEFDDETLRIIQANENVQAVEPDRIAYIAGAAPPAHQAAGSSSRRAAAARAATVTQTDAPWGLAMLSSREALASGGTRGHAYTYDASAGEGTWAYVLDSGVLTTNGELGGRAVKGYNAWDGVESFDDHFGHGTHVAGTIAAESYGVAKKATIVDVKIVRSIGYSTVSHVIDGINWVVANATGTPGRAAKSVINMSLAFPNTAALDSAVDAASALGILSVVSAGNDGASACTRSPASAASALTVGAVAWDRSRPSWSNFGPCVDVFAPGVNVASLWATDGVESVNSGTSMASPHVAGLALYLKALRPDDTPILLPATPADTIARILDLAIPGVVTNPGDGSPNLLAYNGIA